MTISKLKILEHLESVFKYGHFDTKIKILLTITLNSYVSKK